MLIHKKAPLLFVKAKQPGKIIKAERFLRGEGDLIQVNNYYFYCRNELQKKTISILDGWLSLLKGLTVDGLVIHATQTADFVHIKTYGVVIGDRYELIV